MTGREGAVPITEQTPYEWYKNTGQVYLALTGPCIGAEVVDENGDTIHIVDVFHYREFTSRVNLGRLNQFPVTLMKRILKLLQAMILQPGRHSGLTG